MKKQLELAYQGRQENIIFIDNSSQNLLMDNYIHKRSIQAYNNLDILAIKAPLGLAKELQNQGILLGFDGLVSVNPEELVVSAQDLKKGSWGVDALELERFEDHANGEGVGIAVLDSGVDSNHPALAESTLPYCVTIDRRGVATYRNAPPNDSGSHGTMTASFIVGKPVNGIRTGIALGAKVLSIQILNGSIGRKISVLAGLDQVLNYPEIKIVNLSIETASDPTFAKALQSIVNTGRIVVGAAGNTGPNNLASPGDYPRRLLISSGALYPDNEIWENSNGGTKIWGAKDFSRNEKTLVPMISAPGAELVGAEPGGGFKMASGTSFAAPHVSAACAILAQLDPQISHLEAAELLSHSATDDGKPNWDARYGEGRLNILRALSNQKKSAR